VLIQRGTTIAGYDALQVRSLMRELHHYPATDAWITEFLVDTGQTGAAHRLLDAGLIEDYPRRDYVTHVPAIDGDDLPAMRPFRTTITGNVLGKARIGKPMTRATATKLLSELLGRVEDAISNFDCPYVIERVELFGSFADPARDQVGHVDLRIRFHGRAGVDLIEANRDAVRAHYDAGGSQVHPVDLYGGVFIEKRFMRRIKGRSPRVDIKFDKGEVRSLPEGTAAVEIWPTDRRPS
jgi:hypothetical protein